MRKVIGGAATAAAFAVLAPAASAVTTPGYAVRPMQLPPAGARAASAQRGGWLVGAKPGARSAAIARRFGARQLRLKGAFAVPRERARGLAAALRSAGQLVYAEPDSRLVRHSAPDANAAGWARAVLVPPTLGAPAARFPVAIIDDYVDNTLPDLAANTTILNPPATITGAHGTEVASAVGAAAQGTGVIGVYPGVPLLSYGLPSDITCAAAANGIIATVNAGARVVNLSFGSQTQCFTLFRAVEGAYGAGALIVAAGGNEFLQGNRPSYPAAWPHVLSVAAINPAAQPAFFSNRNVAIDIAAPGEGVPLDTPIALDTDGTPDGVTLDSGTSFAAPMVAGAAAWVWSARADLSNGQLADVLRESANDVPPVGYDANTGFGVANVPQALAAPTPVDDPLEPNDEITFIDGTSFRDPDPYVWTGTRTPALRASVDVVEDPVDVYRIRIPGGAAARVVLRTRFGDADLFGFSGRARTLSGTPLRRSIRNGRATDAITLRNRSQTAQRFYVAIASGSRTSLNSAYTLTFRRG